MKNIKALKRMSARMILIIMLISILTPFVFAAGDDFRYAIYFNYFIHNWSVKINGAETYKFEAGNSEIVLTKEDHVRAELSLTAQNGDFTGGQSKLISFASSEDGLAATSYVRHDALILPDGTYAAISPLSETLTFDGLCLTEDKTALNYAFTLEGEYDAVSVTLDEIRAAQELGAGGSILWNTVDTSKPYRISIRAQGRTDSPVPLEYELNERGLRCNFVLTEGNGLTAQYEINTGSGWQIFDIASWREKNSDRNAQLLGRNFIYDSYSFSLRTAYGETPTFELIDPVTVGSVAVSAAAAAVGAAAVSAASASSVSEAAADAAVSAVEEDTPRSLMINGGVPCPQLSNTEKATVEIPLNVYNGPGPYTWRVTAFTPDCIGAAIASAVPPVGTSSCAVVMLKGKKLPKNKISVFLQIDASGFDGEEYTASAELALYEKGFFAELKNAERPESPESYSVTSIKDANFDGIAEVKTLKPTEYIVELYEDRAVIRAGEKSAVVELKKN